MNRVLVTGCAGFIGSHLCEQLLADGVDVVGVDGFIPTYPRWRKELHLDGLLDHPRFRFVERDLADDAPLDELVDGMDTIFHLAARAGVRDSFGLDFRAYVDSNLVATQRLLEAAATSRPDAFVYASSSSVYGNAEHHPTTEDEPLRPVSPYGMTKLATEALARTYHDISGLRTVGMRYFTVYGPRQRPDMAFSKFFTRALEGQPIEIHGDGEQQRDFTYVGDAVDATIAAAQFGEGGTAYNVGGGRPVRLIEAIDTIAGMVARPLRLHFHPAARGDARHTAADGSRCARDLGVVPATPLAEGLAAQMDWICEHSRERVALVA